jgi:hypothetical protein
MVDRSFDDIGETVPIVGVIIEQQAMAAAAL